MDTDLQKATSEVILLREEESKLRHENLQLKVRERISLLLSRVARRLYIFFIRGFEIIFHKVLKILISKRLYFILKPCYRQMRDSY